MSVFRYKFVGVCQDDLIKKVPGTPSLGSIGPYTYVDVTATDQADLDTYMNSLGFTYVSTDPTNTPEDQASLTHETLRQLIHFIDNGPAEGFASGAYRENTGTVFPTAITWYDQAGVGKKKIVEKLITWTGAFPTTIAWKVYDASETLLATVSDSISYSGPFETHRTRTIS